METSTSARQRWGLEQRALASSGALALPTSPLSLRYKARRTVHTHRDHVSELVRRAVNVVVACVGLVLTAPLMLVTAVLVKLTSPGPIIFRQERVGLDRRSPWVEDRVNRRRSRDLGGRIFTMYKFRTMTVQETGTPEVWASRNDPRITSVGRFLRATRLDELPQLFNVLKGDMNIVGPRPEQPSIFLGLREEVATYKRRQRVLPGITGLAQIEVGYDTDLDGVRKKVEYDLEYIRRRSAAEDLMIMAKTVPVMVFRKEWM